MSAVKWQERCSLGMEQVPLSLSIDWVLFLFPQRSHLSSLCHIFKELYWIVTFRQFFELLIFERSGPSGGVCQKLRLLRKTSNKLFGLSHHLAHVHIVSGAYKLCSCGIIIISSLNWGEGIETWVFWGFLFCSWADHRCVQVLWASPTSEHLKLMTRPHAFIVPIKVFSTNYTLSQPRSVARKGSRVSGEATSECVFYCAKDVFNT